MKSLLKLLFIVCSFSKYVLAEDACSQMIPEIESNFNGLKAIPGGIAHQIQIDKEASGLSRFTFESDVLLMDAERVPLLSQKRKTIRPIESLEGLSFQGIHIAGKTNKIYHRGIEIFDMSLTSEPVPKSNGWLEKSDLQTNIFPEDSITLQLFSYFSHVYYFQNFQLKSARYERDLLEGPLWILRHQEDRTERWSHHSFLINSGLILPVSPILNLYFETDFDNTAEDAGFILNWIGNSTSGPRIDTCVYFLVS